MFEFFSALDQEMHDINYPITDSWEPMDCTTTLGAPGLFQNFDIRIPETAQGNGSSDMTSDMEQQ